MSYERKIVSIMMILYLTIMFALRFDSLLFKKSLLLTQEIVHCEWKWSLWSKIKVMFDQGIVIYQHWQGETWKGILCLKWNISLLIDTLLPNFCSVINFRDRFITILWRIMNFLSIIIIPLTNDTTGLYFKSKMNHNLLKVVYHRCRGLIFEIKIKGVKVIGVQFLLAV